MLRQTNDYLQRPNEAREEELPTHPKGAIYRLKLGNVRRET